jgi:hypothetical protein
MSSTMNREHISLLAAPLYAALIVTAGAERQPMTDDWHLMAQGIAVRRALQLWRETLGNGDDDVAR